MEPRTRVSFKAHAYGTGVMNPSVFPQEEESLNPLKDKGKLECSVVWEKIFLVGAGSPAVIPSLSHP